MNYLNRLDGLRASLVDSGIGAFVSLSAADNFYMTGFTGSTSAIIVTADAAVFLCDPRYTEQARGEVKAFDVEEIRGSFLLRTAERLKSLDVGDAAFDPGVTTVAQANILKEAFAGELQCMPDGVGRMRTVKDTGEIERVRAASELAEGALADVLGELKAGITEQEVAARLDYEFKRRGASGPSFDTIVLFGARSSLPHGQPSDVPLKSGDIVLIDLGCRRVGYCSDLTRTSVYDRIPEAWFQEIYDVTLAAQGAAIAALRPGIAAREVDAVARNHIADAGYAEFFGHGLGHGVGIEIHEQPRLNSESDVILQKGMVVTVEPGIYLPGRGGVRIEDLTVITEDGCEVLSKSPRELKVLS